MFAWQSVPLCSIDFAHFPLPASRALKSLYASGGRAGVTLKALPESHNSMLTARLSPAAVQAQQAHQNVMA